MSLYGKPAITATSASYKDGWYRPHLIIVHAKHDDGSLLIASLDRSVDLGEILVITINGEEVARAYGADTLSLMKRYGITHEFPAFARKSIVVDWATYWGVDPSRIAWWR